MRPAGTPGLRLDTGVAEGGEIPIHYDSMIGKLIACGTDRADAIRRLRAGLDAAYRHAPTRQVAPDRTA